MAIEFAKSAFKWGIEPEEALYAMGNAVYTSDKVRINAGDRSHQRRVFVGPQHAQTARLIEVLIEVKRPGTFVVYHAMPLGPLYRRQMEEEQ